MADDLNIVCEVKFDESNADKNLKKILDKLQKNNKLKIDFDNNSFDFILNKVNALEKKLNQNFNINVNGLTNSLNNIGVQVDNISKRQLKIVDGDKVRLVEKYNDNLLKTREIIRNLKSGEETIINSEDYAKAKNILYKELLSLQSQEFNLKNDLISKDGVIKQQLEEQLRLIKQQQTEIGRSINQYGIKDALKNNEILVERKKLISDLIIAQEKYNSKVATDQKDIQTRIRQYQDDMDIKIQNLNTKYRELVPTMELEQLKFKIEDLSKIDFKNFKELRETIKDIDNQFKGIQADTREKGLMMGQRDSQGLLTTLKSDMTKLGLWIGVGTVLRGAINQFRDMISYTRDMDTALTDLSKVVNITKYQMEDMKISAIDLGRELGKSSVDIMQGMAEFGRITKNLSEIKELTRVATMASNVTDLSVADASKALSSTMVNFKLSAKDAITILDQWNEIQNNFRVSAQDLASAIGEVGAAAIQSGTSIEDLEGYITALVSATDMGGTEAGTSVKSMISRVYRIGAEGAEDAGKAEEALKSMGVATRKASGDFEDFSKILKDTRNQWGYLSKNQQFALAQAVGGTHHYSKFITLMENMPIAIEATNKALNSQGSALEENIKYINSVAGQWATFKTNLENIWQQMLNSDDLKNFISLGNGILSIVERFGGLNTVLLLTTFTVLSTSKAFKQMLVAMNLTSIKSFTTAFTFLPHVFRQVSVSGEVTASKMMWLGMQFDLLKLKAIALQATFTFGLSLAITGIVSGVMALTNHLKHQREEVEKVTEEYKNLQKAIQDSNEEAIRSESDNFKQKQDNLQELMKKRKKLIESNSVSAKTGEGFNDAEIIKLTKQIEDEIKILEKAGLSVDKYTGEILALQDAENELNRIKGLDILQTIALVEKYNELASVTDIESDQISILRNVVEELKRQYPELTITYDKNGKAIINNIDLIYDNIKAINAEKGSVLGLAQQHYSTTTNIGNNQMAMTKTVIDEITKRIKAYTMEIEAIKAYGNFKDRTPRMLMNDVGDRAFEESYTKDAQKRINELNKLLNEMKNISKGIIGGTPPPLLGDDGKGGKNSLSNIDIKVDRYYKLNNAIKDVTNALSLLDAQEDKAQGLNKIAILNKKNELLARQKQLTLELLKEQEKERNELQKQLKSAGFNFNGYDLINPELLKSKADYANSITNESKRKSAQQQVKDLEEMMKRYTDLTHDTIGKTKTEWEELGNAINGVKDSIKNVIEEQTNLINDLYNKIENALRKMYDQQDRMKKMQKLNEELSSWKKDDSVLGKGKVTKLEEQLRQEQEDEKIRQEAKNMLLQSKTEEGQKAILNLLESYDEDYRNVADRLGGGFAETFLQSLAESLEQASIVLSESGKVGFKFNIPQYADGGINTTTGLAMMHGTKDKPELIFNDYDARKLWNIIRNSPINPMMPRYNMRNHNLDNLPVKNQAIFNNNFEVTNNTPFDVQNNMDNFTRMLKHQAQRLGYSY